MMPPLPNMVRLTDAQRDWMADNDHLTRWGAGIILKRRPYIDRDEANFLAVIAMIRAINKHIPARGKLATCFYQQLRLVMSRYAYYDKPLGCRHGEDPPKIGPIIHDNIDDRRYSPPAPFAADNARAILAALPSRYANVLRLRFIEGLKLQEIGSREGVTKERARQLVDAALIQARRVAEERRIG